MPSDKTLYEQVNEISLGLANLIKDTNDRLKMVTEAYPYQINHDPIITLTLEQEYERIISEYPELSTESCYGARIELKSGDNLPISQSVFGRAFINGQEYTTDYRYTGDNQESVIVFYFPGGLGLNLPPVNLNTVDVLVKNGVGSLNIDKSWYMLMGNLTVVGEFEVYNTTICNSCYLDLYEINNTDRLVPKNVKTFKVTCEKITAGSKIFYDRTFCGTIELPNVHTITGANYTNRSVLEAPTTNCTISFPKLRSISSTASGGGMVGIFRDIILPDTITSVGKQAFNGITNLFDLTNAVNATFAYDWYINTAPNTVVFPEGWKNSINLAVVGAKQTKAWFLEVFDKLMDVTDLGTRQITIPLNVTARLTEAEMDIARLKGWTVQGA